MNIQVAVLLLGLMVSPFFLKGQSKADYMNTFAMYEGEWHMKEGGSENMPELKMVCKTQEEKLHRTMYFKNEEGNWGTAWEQTEVYDEASNKIKYEGKDAQFGDYRGEVALDSEGVQHLTEYNADDQKTTAATITQQNKQELLVNFTQFMDEEGKIHDSPQREMTTTWVKK